MILGKVFKSIIAVHFLKIDHPEFIGKLALNEDNQWYQYFSEITKKLDVMKSAKLRTYLIRSTEPVLRKFHRVGVRILARINFKKRQLRISATDCIRPR